MFRYRPRVTVEQGVRCIDGGGEWRVPRSVFPSFLRPFRPVPTRAFVAGKCARGLFGPNRVQIIDHKDLIFRIFAGLFFEKKFAEGPFLKF